MSLNPDDYTDELEYLIAYVERRKKRITPYTKEGFKKYTGKPLTELEREFYKGSLDICEQVLYELNGLSIRRLKDDILLRKLNGDE
jgi:hypothetical protein